MREGGFVVVMRQRHDCEQRDRTEAKDNRSEWAHHEASHRIREYTRLPNPVNGFLA